MMALHPGGTALAHATEEGAVWVADRSSGTERLWCYGPEPVVALGFDPPGKTMLVVRSGRADAWDFGSARVAWTLAGSFYNATPAWTTDGRRLALSTAADNHVLVCDAGTGSVQQTLAGHQLPARSLAFHPDGRRLFTAGWDGALMVWDAILGAELLRTRAWPRLLRVSADGGRLAMCPSLGEVTIAAIAPVHLFQEFDGGPVVGGHICPLAVSPDGRWVVSTSRQEVRLWEVAAGRSVWSTAVVEPDWAGVTFTADGHTVIQSARSQGIFRRALLLEGPDGPALGPAEAVAPGRPAHLVRMDHATGDWWVERPDRGKLVRWPGGDPQQELTSIDIAQWDGPALSPNLRWSVSGAGAGPGLKVWDLAELRMVARLPSTHHACFEFSPDGQWLVTGTEREYQLWETGTWRAGPSWPARLDSELAGGIFFAPAGDWVAVTQGGGKIELRETRAYSLLVTLEPPVPVRSGIVRWSPDGSRLFMLSMGHRLICWDISALQRELAARGLAW
jgi:WD40 repeat protein